MNNFYEIPVGDEQNTAESVDLIASGYDWVCPKCDAFGHEIEVKEKVTCEECGVTWEVGDHHHAYK